MHGQTITFTQESDQEPGFIPGDVIFILNMEHDDRFERRDQDLYTQIHISLQEALCGFDKILLRHIDGRGIRVKHDAGKVIKPGSFKRIAHEGMPIYRRPDDKGDLYIQFLVDFPDHMWTYQHNIDLIRSILPSSVASENDNGDMVIDECSLLDVNIDPNRDFEQGSRQAHRDDLDTPGQSEREKRPATGVNCPQQ